MKKENLAEISLMLHNSIVTEDIVGLIGSIDALRLDKSYSPVIGFTRNLIMREVQDYITENNLECLRVRRKGEYNSYVTDDYTVKDNVLYRNGTYAKWSQIGKLYTAYEFITRK